MLTVAPVVVGLVFFPQAASAGGNNLIYNKAQGPVIHKLVVDEIFWLPTGYTYDKVNGDTKYEKLMRRFVSDLGGTPYYNIVTQRDRSKDIGILVLRHQLAVLQRQQFRSRFAPDDRATLTALTRELSRDR